MEISIELAHKRFVTKESMVARILIRNLGSAPIEVPNPESKGNTNLRYTIVGPSYPKGYSFSFGEPGSSARAKDSLVMLAPGQTAEGSLPLEQLVHFPQHGDHTITASLEIQGETITSEPVAFAIEAAVIHAMQPLIDDGVQASNPIRVLCLVGGSPERDLYQAILREDRPDLGEVSLAKMVPLAVADPQATTVFGPWTNHDRLDSMLNRFGWQAGAVLGVEGLASTPSMRFTLPSTPKQIVRPALMPESGELDVFAIGADGKTLELVRFPTARTGAGATRQWSVQLPESPLGARAALGPGTGNTGRRASVLVLPTAGGVSMMLVESDAVDVPPRTRSVLVPGAVPLPDSEPAVTVGPDGTIRASALFAEETAFRRVFVADVTWPPGASDGTVAKTNAGRLPSPPRSAAVTFSVTRRPPDRRDWVVLLRDGTVVFSGSPGRPRRLNGSLLLPLDLVAMSRMTYLLTLDAQGLPQLELMH